MTVAVIGGGPAGLRAAEAAALGGAAVTLFEGKPSVGRKFLVAGRGGLNLTHAEAPATFAARYTGSEQPDSFWPALLGKYDSDAIRAWAAALGVSTFAASTGRVYPEGLKAAPLLRRWVVRLREMGVAFASRHYWLGLDPATPLRLFFANPMGPRWHCADAVVLALGGGSWPATGSDGGWVSILEKLGIGVNPLTPANCGWEFAWPREILAVAEGLPLKSIAVRASETEVLGELLVTSYGLEGGALYRLGACLRRMPTPAIEIDFKPTFSIDQLIKKMGPIRRNFLPEAASRWRLPPAAMAILTYLSPHASWASAENLARHVKSFPLQLAKARPLAEAISSAGGVRWKDLDEQLMLRGLPGVFIAGEMIDWEAPTGGYLLHGCLASGAHAGTAAAAWAAKVNGLSS